MATEVLRRYFAAFNAGDIDGMLAELAEDLVHHVNEGKQRHGKPAFRAFCEHMARCYREELTDIVLFEAENGTRAAAEFTVTGTYLATDDGLPPAHGQTYRLPGGSFMELRDGKITRITTYYNLADWLAQVS
ncbi:MAG: Ketosteroid isomerase-related protein [Rhodobacteraceae bacterium HLUCCA08]|nr:MAG: Ketosteroid isomerase-related protein [Rhodobacteraceae bacterium HLUCCA08]